METYEVWVHRIMNLHDPVAKILDLAFKVPRKGRTFKRPEYAQHPCCCPCVAWTYPHESSCV